eukprot:403336770
MRKSSQNPNQDKPQQDLSSQMCALILSSLDFKINHVLRDLQEYWSKQQQKKKGKEIQFFAEAHNLTKDSSYEEVLFVANDLKQNLKLPLDQAFYALYRVIGKADVNGKFHRHLFRYLWVNQEFKHQQQVLKFDSIDQLKKANSHMEKQQQQFNDIKQLKEEVLLKQEDVFKDLKNSQQINNTPMNVQSTTLFKDNSNLISTNEAVKKQTKKYKSKMQQKQSIEQQHDTLQEYDFEKKLEEIKYSSEALNNQSDNFIQSEQIHEQNGNQIKRKQKEQRIFAVHNGAQELLTNGIEKLKQKAIKEISSELLSELDNSSQNDITNNTTNYQSNQLIKQQKPKGLIYKKNMPTDDLDQVELLIGEQALNQQETNSRNESDQNSKNISKKVVKKRQKIVKHEQSQDEVQQLIFNSMLNQVEDGSGYRFIKIEDESQAAVPLTHLIWINQVDDALPYYINFGTSPNTQQYWKYVSQNFTDDLIVQKYLKNKRRITYCKCTDGCQVPKKCACYKYNRSLINPTYETMYHEDNTMIAIQTRAIQSNNRTLTFNECHPRCACNKDLCMNFLMESDNKHKWKTAIKRVKKVSVLRGQSFENVMWGLFTLEQIPAGAFVVEYLGEVLTAKEGDKRGKVYDKVGMSYLFDMSDPDDQDEYDMRVQHSNIEGFTYHKIGLFTTKVIQAGEELTIDYKWDKNFLNIPHNVACLCEKPKCRKYLMKSAYEKHRLEAGEDLLLAKNQLKEGSHTVKKEEIPQLLTPSQINFNNDFSDTLSEMSSSLKKRRIKKKVFIISKSEAQQMQGDLEQINQQFNNN